MDQMKDGPTKTLEAAEQAGIPTSIIEPIQDQAGGPPLVTPLGYFPVAPVDMANAYATLAADGKRADWYVIQSVKDFRGKTQYEHKVKTEQSIPKDVAADTIAAMQKVVNSGAAGTGSNARTICPTGRQDRHGDGRTRQRPARVVVVVRRLLTQARDGGDVQPRQARQRRPRGLHGAVLRRTDPGHDVPDVHERRARGLGVRHVPASRRTSRAPRARPTRSPRPSATATSTSTAARPSASTIRSRRRRTCGPNQQPDGNLGCEPKPPTDQCPTEPATDRAPTADPPTNSRTARRGRHLARAPPPGTARDTPTTTAAGCSCFRSPRCWVCADPEDEADES